MKHENKYRRTRTLTGGGAIALCNPDRCHDMRAMQALAPTCARNMQHATDLRRSIRILQQRVRILDALDDGTADYTPLLRNVQQEFAPLNKT